MELGGFLAFCPPMPRPAMADLKAAPWKRGEQACFFPN
jgi:hypothetical protein